MSERFTWMPLGGLGEIGMNCMMLRFGDHTIPIDAGVVFADPNDYGIDAVYPDFRKALTEFKIKEWLITHGHEDHIGAVPAVFYLCKRLGIEPPHFYAPSLAHALIEQKLADSHYPGVNAFAADHVHAVKPGDEMKFGDVKVKFIEIRHSTPESCSLAFEWKNLRALHTADFKLDYHEFEDGSIPIDHLNVFGKTSPDFLFIDSTNAERSGQSYSEHDIRDNLEKAIRETGGRLFVTLFSSNVYRIALLIHLAEKVGRKVCLAGRSMQQIYQASRKLGIFEKCPSFSEETLIQPEESVNLPPEKILIICSGSQGEFRSVLSKIAARSHPVFQAQESDTILFSSKMIPGNEKSILRLINSLLQLNTNVLWGDLAEETIGGPIHASGHGRADELQEVLRHLKPLNVIPVHGALYQLRSTEKLVKDVAIESGIAMNSFIALNNSFLSFEHDGAAWKLTDHHFEFVPQEKFLRFEDFDCPSRDPFLKERKFAADGGCLSVTIDSIGRITVDMKGVLPRNFEFSQNMGREKLEAEIHSWVAARIKVLEKNSQLKPDRLASIKNEVEEDLSRWVKRLTGARPITFVHFVQL